MASEPEDRGREHAHDERAELVTRGRLADEGAHLPEGGATDDRDAHQEREAGGTLAGEAPEQARRDGHAGTAGAREQGQRLGRADGHGIPAVQPVKVPASAARTARRPTAGARRRP